jgi:predicted RNase H-like HicB family nuclease
MTPYTMIVEWSEADQLFLVTIPEFSEKVFISPSLR